MGINEVAEKVISKIRKLLDRTVNNPHQGEVEAALLLAQRLMVEHGVTMMDVATEDQKKTKEVVKEAGHDFTRTPWWYKELGMILANNFRCYLYMDRVTGGGSRVMFMRLRDDVEITKVLFQYAMINIHYQTQRMRRKIRKQGTPTDGIAVDYTRGFLNGLRDKFREQVDTNQWGLVLVKDSDVVEAYDKMSFTKGKPIFTPRRAFNDDAYNTGYKHGKSFDKPAGQIED